MTCRVPGQGCSVLPWGLLCDLCHPPCIFSGSPVCLMGVGSKHCPVLEGGGWGSRGRGTAPSCARSTNPEGGSQGGQLRKDGPVSRTHHEHHLLPQLLLWATPRAGRKAELWQPPAWGSQGARDGQTWPHRSVCFQEAAVGRKGPCNGPLWPACLKASACPSGEWGSGESRARLARCADPPQAGAQGPPTMHSPPLGRGEFPVFLGGYQHLRTGLLPHKLSPS